MPNYTIRSLAKGDFRSRRFRIKQSGMSFKRKRDFGFYRCENFYALLYGYQGLKLFLRHGSFGVRLAKILVLRFIDPPRNGRTVTHGSPRDGGIYNVVS